MDPMDRREMVVGAARSEAGFETPVPEQHTAALETEAIAGRRLATRSILVGLVVIAGWLLIQLGWERVWFYEVILALFAVIFYADYRLGVSRFARPWQPYLFVALGAALLAFTLVVPNPFVDNWPTPMRLRFGNFVYMMAFLAPVALSYSPLLMVWAGLCCAFFWGIGVLWVLALPETVTWLDFPPASGDLAAGGEAATGLLGFYLRPEFVDIEARIQDVIVILLFSSVLALVVWRSRRLVMRQIAVARERANLARHFPPSVVDRLARQDKPLGAVRAQPVAVMFVDIVAFTEFAEGTPPERVVETLRAYHVLIERRIFEYGGTLDKFLGDGVMATFGAPEVGSRDAVNALASACAIQRDMADWNVARRRAGEPPIAVSIGLNYGEGVLGDIGSERRFELAVLGDVVNVASRLEALTREVGCGVILSGDLVGAARRQDAGAAADLLDGFSEGASRSLRGRAQPVTIWTLAAPSTAAQGA